MLMVAVQIHFNMSLVESVKSCIGKYAVFSGRASRSEYWWFYFANVLLYFFGSVIFGVIGYLFGDIILFPIFAIVGTGLVSLFLIIPGIAVTVRRLHDTGHSGFWWFIAFVPLIGPIWLLVLLLTGSDDENQYGLPVY